MEWIFFILCFLTVVYVEIRMFFFISKIELKLKETEKEEIVKEVLKIRNNRILEALKKSKGVKL